ncbi:MAG: inositol monophosphatase [Candidatus Woesearchaeota archaeon]
MKQIVTQAAYEGGKVLMEFYRGQTSQKDKGERDIVTDADIASERVIIKILSDAFPEHNFLSEEVGHINKNSDYTWIIDPLDGTVNFASKNPLFAISIGLVHKNQVKLSCIYLPILGELFYAEKGKGATLNDKKISISSHTKLKECINSASPGAKTKEKIVAMSKIIRVLLPRGRSLLMYGSTPLALAFVACGRADNYITYKSDVYNMAAGYLLIKEAGGKVTDFENHEFDISAKSLNVIASNGHVHEELLSMMKAVHL